VSPAALLSIEDLSVEFRTRDGVVKALDGVGFGIRPGETVGLVGESGSGKSVTALSILRLLPAAARITSGRAILEPAATPGYVSDSRAAGSRDALGARAASATAFRASATADQDTVDLLAASPRALGRYRGRRIAMIFQNPRASLNPIRPVGDQISDVLRRHAGLSRAAAHARVIELLARVQIPDPERRYRSYPFELSGGMCQRVMIALAIACSPSLLIADEPTTGLDVTTQAGILDLLAELGRSDGMATLLITHDLAVVAERCDRIVVMHAGHVVESADAAALFRTPRHPYTVGLIASTPRAGAKLVDLVPVSGSVPDLRAALGPCRYRTRCERAVAACDDPPLPRTVVAPGHLVACRRPL